MISINELISVNSTESMGIRTRYFGRIKTYFLKNWNIDLHASISLQSSSEGIVSKTRYHCCTKFYEAGSSLPWVGKKSRRDAWICFAISISCSSSGLPRMTSIKDLNKIVMELKKTHKLSSWSINERLWISISDASLYNHKK